MQIPVLQMGVRIPLGTQNTPKDSNGNILQAGDSVVVTQTLKVKGFSSGIKRGTVVKNIRLTDDEDAIEGKVEGSVIVIKTCYLKKK